MDYILSNQFKNNGNVFLFEKKYGDAIDAYLKAIQVNYSNVEAHSNLSCAYFIIEYYDLAVEHARITIKLAPQWSKGYFRLARALLAVEDPLEARSVLLEGVKNCCQGKNIQGRELLKVFHEVDNLCASIHSSHKNCQDSRKNLNSKVLSLVEEFIDCEMKEEEEKSNENLNEKLMETGDHSNSFLKMAQELTNASSKHSYQREQMNESLKEGYAALEKQKYRRAIDCFKEALKISSGTTLKNLNITSKDVAVIHYVLNYARVESNNYEKIVQSIRDMEECHYLTATVPAFSYLLGKAYHKLNRFKQALEPLEHCEEVLQNQFPFVPMVWPSTDKIIKETTREGLEECVKELVHQCVTCPVKPTAICRYDKCCEISTHIIPSDQIYISDPDFIGYISLKCDGKCIIQYHLQCWKAFKETFSNCEKVNDKDMLDRACPTTDCISSNGEQSKICLIEIIGQDGNVKTQIKAEVSQKQIMSKNLKKRKQKLSEKDDKPTEKVVRSKSKPSMTKNNKMKNSVDNSTSGTSLTSSASNDTVVPSETVEEMMKKRLTVLEQLRAINFGCVTENVWNYCVPFYGREDEKEKKEKNIFVPPEHFDEDNTLQFHKEYIMSWFYEVLSKEGPLKVDEIQEQWSSNSNDSDSLFTDVKVVLKDVTNICDLLLESTRFCLIDDYICLSEQLPETYNESKIELTETVSFMLAECMQQEALSQPKINSTACSNISNRVQEESKMSIEEIALISPSADDDNSEIFVSDTNSEFSEDIESDNEDSDSDSDEDDENNEDTKENNTKEHIKGNLEFEISNDKSNVGNRSMELTHRSNESENVASNDSNAAINSINNKTADDFHEDRQLRSDRDTQFERSDKLVSNVTVNLKDKTDVPDCQTKSFTTISTQTDETNASYVKEMQEAQNYNESLKNDLDKLRKQATKSVQIITKIENDKQKLIEQKEKLVLKYQSQNIKKDASFKKEKEKIVAEMDQALAQVNEINKELKDLKELVNNKEAECEKLNSIISESNERRQTELALVLDVVSQFVNGCFVLNETRRSEKLTELEYLSKCDYLPCHKEALQMLKQWNEFNDKQTKSKTQFNLTADKLKQSSNGCYGDIKALFNDLLLCELNDQDPSCIPVEQVVNEVLTVNKNSNSGFHEGSDQTTNVSSPRSITNLKSDEASNAVPLFDPNINCPSTSSAVKEQNLQEVHPEMSDSDGSCDDSKSATGSRAFEFLKNKNNEKSTENKKQKSSQRSDSAKEKNTALTKKPEESLRASIDNLQEVKKAKKGKTKVPQQSNFPSAVSSTSHPGTVNSIWGPVSVQQEWSTENAYDYTRRNSNNSIRDGDTEGEWQVIVDKKTMREHSSTVVRTLTGGPKNVKSNYTLLIERIKNTFPNKTEKEVVSAVKVIRERNSGSLSGLSRDEIEFRVGRYFSENSSKKSVSMGMEKFGETAWGGGVVSSNSNWQCSSDMMDECVICCEDMGTVNLTTLECNHLFHTECIRQWLKERSVCPLCNEFTKMPDEFPAL